MRTLMLPEAASTKREREVDAMLEGFRTKVRCALEDAPGLCEIMLLLMDAAMDRGPYAGILIAMSKEYQAEREMDRLLREVGTA